MSDKIRSSVHYKKNLNKFLEECFNSVNCHKGEHSAALREQRNAVRNTRLQQSANQCTSIVIPFSNVRNNKTEAIL